MQIVDEVHQSAMSEDDVNVLFHELMSKHNVRLYRFVLKYIGNATEAEELAQQAFVEAAGAIREFRGHSQLSTWLYGIAMNLVRNHLSRAPHRVHRFVDESALDYTPCGGSGPQQTLENQQLLGLVDVGLAGLMPEMREALMLVAVDEMTYEEAAVQLSLPIGTVRSRVSRARSRLRKHFESAGVDLMWAA